MEVIGWGLIGVAGLFFLIGMAGLINPAWMKNPNTGKVPSRWMMLLTILFVPPLFLGFGAGFISASQPTKPVSFSSAPAPVAAPVAVAVAAVEPAPVAVPVAAEPAQGIEPSKVPYLAFEPPTKYSSVAAAIDGLRDFSSELETFKLIATKPVTHIQLLPLVEINTKFPELVKEQVIKTLFYGVYRSFIHTSVNRIRVTVLPVQATYEPEYSEKPLKSEQITVELTRDQAVALAVKNLGINSLDELVATRWEIRSKDEWSPVMGEALGIEKGKSSINMPFFFELLAVGAKK